MLQSSGIPEAAAFAYFVGALKATGGRITPVGSLNPPSPRPKQHGAPAFTCATLRCTCGSRAEQMPRHKGLTKLRSKNRKSPPPAIEVR